MKLFRHTIIGWIIALGIVGCSGNRMTPPDLGEIYNRVAKYHNPERNPVIVIPGILGTRLIDPESGRIVWGAFGGQSANPKHDADARLVALPMAEGQRLGELRDAVMPDGVLEKVQVKLAGLPIELKAYIHILLTLGAGGYRDETLKLDWIDYGSDHYTCFQFDYDWRRDNVENAQRLHAFIEEKRAYVQEKIRQRYGVENPNVKFDIIAHSMGGLLARYFLRYGDADLPEDGSLPELTWAGAKHVDRAVLVGTPNAGAIESLKYLTQGRKFGPFTPIYEPAVLGTFPSMFQLLPRARHGALVDGTGNVLDPLDPELWLQKGWGLASSDQDPVLQQLLPDAASGNERRSIATDHLRKSLARARQFHESLDRPASGPDDLRLHLFAGDAIKTPYRATVLANSQIQITDDSPGDGSVLRSSALMDERLGQRWQPRVVTPIDWDETTFLFTNHLGLTGDPIFTDNVLYLLLESPE